MMEIDVDTVGSAVRKAPEYSFKGCLICQTKTNSKNERVAKPKLESLQKLLICIEERSNYFNPEYRRLFIQLQNESAHSIADKGGFYHRECYQKATHAEHIAREKNYFLSRAKEIPSGYDSDVAKIRTTRSSVDAFDREMCIICQSRSDDEKGLHNIETKNMNWKLRRAIEVRKDEEMRIRLSSASDATAAEIKYHLPCWVRYVDRPPKEESTEDSELVMKRCVIEMELVCMVEVALCEGSIITMKDVQEGYTSLAEECEFVDSRETNSQKKYLKKLIESKIPSAVFEKAIQKNQSERLYARNYGSEILQKALDNKSETTADKIKVLWKAADILRKDIAEFNQQHKFQAKDLTSLSPEALPESIVSFLRWILVGRKDLKGARESSVKQIARSLCSLLLYNMKTSRQVNYKPVDEEKSVFQNTAENKFVVGMSLSLRSFGRKSSVLNMLHKYGLAISNSRCLLYETGLANAVIKTMQNNDGIFIPSNCKRRHFPVFHLDNADWKEDRLQTTHNLLLVGFQETEPEISIMEVDLPTSYKLMQNSFGDLKPHNKPSTHQFQRTSGSSNFQANEGPDTPKSVYKQFTLPWVVARSMENLLSRGALVQQTTEVADIDMDTPMEVLFVDDFSPSRCTSSPKVSDVDVGRNTIRLEVPSSKTLSLDSNPSIPSWGAYNSILYTNFDSQPKRTNTLLFPLIPGPADDYSAVYTALKQAQHITVWCCGEGRKTVVSLDLDLYARALLLCEGDTQLRGKFILRLGELHVVFAQIRAIGNFIESSGIDSVWIESEVYGPNHVKSILSCTHMKRAVTAHEATLLAMYRIYFKTFFHELENAMPKPIDELCEDLKKLNSSCQREDANALQESHWKFEKRLEEYALENLMERFEGEREGNSMFRFIRIYMNMVERLLLFIHASRSRNWELHLAAGENLIKDFVSMDRLKYRRLMPVYIANMKALESEEPEIWKALKEGQFGVQKSSVPFTTIGVDHAGEQINKLLKVDGGLSGISSNQNARTRWMLIVPMILRLTQQMKNGYQLDHNEEVKHHQLSSSYLRKQTENADKIETCLSLHCGTLFEKIVEPSMYNLVTKATIPDSLHKDILSSESIGRNVYLEFVSERMMPEAKISIWEPIKKLKLGKFSSINRRAKVTTASRVMELKQSRGLLGRLILVCKSNRELNLREVIGTYELQVIPRSLMSSDGNLHPGHEGKSQLLKQLELIAKKDSESPECQLTQQGSQKIVIIDGMVYVQKLTPKPSWVKTVEDLSRYFFQKIDSATRDANEIHLVFDTYKDNSLKQQTRQRRRGNEQPIAYRIEDTTNIQRLSMSKFLSSDLTKQRLTEYLAEKSLVHFQKRSALSFLVSSNGKTEGNIPCTPTNNHEEADTFLVLHALEASATHDANDVIIVQSPDTDVLVMLVAFADRLLKSTLFSLNQNRNIPVRRVFESLGPSKSRALIGFHAFTGCDTTGKLFGKGKGSWFNHFLKTSEDVITAIRSLETDPLGYINQLEKFVATFYCPNAKNVTSLPEARWHMFCKNSEECEKLPPTPGAFEQHVLRAHLQAKTWYAADCNLHSFVNPCEFGWKIGVSGFEPTTSLQEIAPTSLVQLSSCHCKTNCSTNRCSCRRHNMSCVDMCTCTECENSDNRSEEIGEDEDEDN